MYEMYDKYNYYDNRIKDILKKAERNSLPGGQRFLTRSNPLPVSYDGF